MTIIVGIDPGPEYSGQVVVDGSVWPPIVLHSDGDTWEEELIPLRYKPNIVVCEWVISYGSTIGATVLDTARLVGRIEERSAVNKLDFYRITRPEVGLEIAGSRRSKKGQTNEAIREIYKKERPDLLGGGKNPTVGIKKAPGPLYGVKSHAWDALAVIIAWMIIHGKDRERGHK